MTSIPPTPLDPRHLESRPHMPQPPHCPCCISHKGQVLCQHLQQNTQHADGSTPGVGTHLHSHQRQSRAPQQKNNNGNETTGWHMCNKCRVKHVYLRTPLPQGFDNCRPTDPSVLGQDPQCHTIWELNDPITWNEFSQAVCKL